MDQNLHSGIAAGDAAVNPHTAKSDLLRKLNDAYEVLIQAFGHFDEAARHSEVLATKQKSKKKFRTWLIVTVVIYCWLMSANSASLVLFLIPAALALGYDRARKGVLEAERMVKAYQETGERILNQNTEQLSFIPEEYRYPQAVEYLMKYLREDRADTMREAYKLYDNQCLQWKMDQYLSETARQAAVQSAYLASIRRGVIITSAMTTASAVHNLFSDN